MSETEQFLKDVEADIAKINAALEHDDEDDVLICAPLDQPDGDASDSGSVLADLTAMEPRLEEDELADMTDMPELETLIRDHEALLLKIDSVLMQQQEREGSNNEYEMYSAVPPHANPIDVDEESGKEDEEEDYFKDMNKFVEEGTVVDVEKLYDVLETNLQYQDFLTKLTAEIERRLKRNNEKQKEMGEEEDHRYLSSLGYSAQALGPRPLHNRVLSLQRFKPPYFTNYYRIGPRMNEDQARLSSNPRFLVYQHESGWGKGDRNNLLDCLRTVIVDEEMTQSLLTSTKEDTDCLLKDLYDKPRDAMIAAADVDNWTDHQWQEVTMSLSALGCNRSRFDCEGQWRNHLSASTNKSAWSAHEDQTLQKLAAIHGTNNWQLIATKLRTNRRAWQCLQRFQKVKKKTSTQWNVMDDKQLKDAVMIYGDASFTDLSYFLGDKTSDQCLQRWRYSISPQIKRGKWTQDEDAQVMSIISEHGFDWQKIKDVQKHRTRAQVRERVRILLAKERSGSNGGASSWTVQESLTLMGLIKRHGATNWAKIRSDMNLRYTAPVLFRRWVRLTGLLTGTCKRIALPWERSFLKELLAPGKHLTPELQLQLKDMLPNDEQKIRIQSILEKSKVNGRSYCSRGLKGLKRQREEDATEDEEEEEPQDAQTRSVASARSAPTEEMFNLLRLNAGKIYKTAFEVGTGTEFKMYYTPPSVTTLGAFKRLLVEQCPKLRETAAEDAAAPLSEDVLASEEFNLLAARFKSLFSWPLIMGETPV